MKAMLLILSTLTACTAGLAGETEGIVFDDSYVAAIEDAINLVEPQDHEYIRDRLEGSMWAWKKKPPYIEVRQRAASLSEASDQIRLEIGNENTGSYEAAWLIKAGDVHLISQIGIGRQLRSRTVSQEEWMTLLREIEAVWDKSLSCPSDLSVNDGSTYFLSISLEGRVRQTAIYGPLPFDRKTLGAAILAKQGAMEPCRGIIMKLLSLARGKTQV